MGAAALVIGGRSGVGKSTVAWEVSAQMQRREVAHFFVEEDFLDQALTASDGTAREPLGGREIGSQLAAHVDRSARLAEKLAASAPPWVVRVPTDGRTVVEVAEEVLAATGWAAAP